MVLNYFIIVVLVQYINAISPGSLKNAYLSQAGNVNCLIHMLSNVLMSHNSRRHRIYVAYGAILRFVQKLKKPPPIIICQGITI